MKKNVFLALFITQIFFIWIKTLECVKPNIVLIIADDLGWNDVSFHGSDQIQTPNIDTLAYSGVILHQYRTHCQCTPSRAALLTGKYAHRVGMQGYPLTNGEDRGLPVDIKILPQYLKDLNYATHLVGKWHLGHSRKVYLPQNRGFDTYFGHRGGFLDYYEYVAEETWTLGKVSGLDLFRNFSAAWDVEGYITDVYTKEAKSIINSHDTRKSLFLQLSHTAPHSANEGSLLQAPPEVVRQMRHVESPQRRIYAAMVKKLDDSVGEIVKSLYEKEILNNTIIIFMSDNGGMTVKTTTSPNYASNWPLKGLKMSPWDGGIRVIGSVWSPNITSNIWNGYIHSVDWLPTLLKAVGGEIPEGIDGVDLWNEITNNKNSLRKSMFEIDDYTGFATIIQGKYKLVKGKIDNIFNKHYGEDLKGIIGKAPTYIDAIIASETFNVFQKYGRPLNLENLEKRNDLKIHCNDENNISCIPNNDKYCLYNIEEDPCELVDLSNDSTYIEICNKMNQLIDEEFQKRIPRTIPLFRDPRALPKLFNYTWTTWHDDII